MGSCTVHKLSFQKLGRSMTQPKLSQNIIFIIFFIFINVLFSESYHLLGSTFCVRVCVCVCALLLT